MTLFYLIAGEASGDALGARLIAALRTRRPDAVFAGVGGERMAEAGMPSLFPMREIALMGLVEVLPRVLAVRRRIAETVADIARRRPAVVVTIDSPGFGLRVQRSAAARRARRVHYVAPQVWGWRQGRVRRYPGAWDEMLCLLPFEPGFFQAHGIPARFTGHPVLESGAGGGDGGRFRARHGIGPEAPVLVVMPGSRKLETRHLLPVFGEAVRRLAAEIPGLRPVIPVAGPVRDAVRAAAGGWGAAPVLVEGVADKFDAFAAARDGGAALVKSGTSSLELAVAGVPMIVGYRVGAVSAAIVRRLVRVRFASIVNLLADRAVIPELIQEECMPGRIVDGLRPLLRADLGGGAGARQVAAFAPVLRLLRLGDLAPSEAAAEAILSALGEV